MELHMFTNSSLLVLVWLLLADGLFVDAGNTARDDLWSSFSQAMQMEGKDLNIKEVMDGWTLQMGYPVVTITRKQSLENTLTISQEHFLYDKDAKIHHHQLFNKRYRSDFKLFWILFSRSSGSLHTLWSCGFLSVTPPPSSSPPSSVRTEPAKRGHIKHVRRIHWEGKYEGEGREGSEIKVEHEPEVEVKSENEVKCKAEDGAELKFEGEAEVESEVKDGAEQKDEVENRKRLRGTEMMLTSPGDVKQSCCCCN
ncbi:hypothetical protein HF521_007543 [Silurus meridionalis]|uniref:Uncharacterized protein n=1 Tax=Silurus meridionalis TaxID=175797 RepID=A0A8T0ANX7_SILME|nr:hypothetical protein HF521_007543 [Silurus meridionalis]